jgi:hypothetical protein
MRSGGQNMKNARLNVFVLFLVTILAIACAQRIRVTNTSAGNTAEAEKISNEIEKVKPEQSKCEIYLKNWKACERELDLCVKLSDELLH